MGNLFAILNQELLEWIHCKTIDKFLNLKSRVDARKYNRRDNLADSQIYIKRRGSIMKNILMLTIFAFVFVSCARNYSEELKEITEKYKKEGKLIIATSQIEHFVVYKDSNAFWINNLDEPAKKILFAEKKMTERAYYMAFDDNGTPRIEFNPGDTITLHENFFQENDTMKEQIGYVSPYYKSNIELLNDSTITFVYQSIFENRGGEPSTSKLRYVYCFLNPDKIFRANMKPVMQSDGSRSDMVKSSVGYLADAVLPVFDDGEVFPYRYGYNREEGGYFTWIFNLDGQEKIKASNTIDYHNDVYKKQMSFPLSAFETKEKSMNALRIINDTIKVASMRKAIADIQKEAIPIYKLAAAYRNQISADRQYKNKTIIVECTLDELVEPDFLNSEHKYKMRSEYAQFFSVNYDIAAYTDDENFVRLSYPAKVIMRAKLRSGSQTGFYFSNCELLVW